MIQSAFYFITICEHIIGTVIAWISGVLENTHRLCFEVLNGSVLVENVLETRYEYLKDMETCINELYVGTSKFQLLM